MPLPSEVKIDRFLTDVLTGEQNDDYIADMVFPILRPSNMTGKVAGMGRDHYRVRFDSRKFGARAFQVDWSAKNVPFEAVEYSVEQPIDDQQLGLVDNPYDLYRDSAFNASHIIWGRVEQEVASVVMTSANYDGNTGAASAAWTTGTTDIVADVSGAIETIIANTGKSPMGIYGCCNWKTFDVIRRNPQVKEAYINTVPGRANVTQMSADTVAAALGLAGLFVGTAVKNTAPEGAAESMSYHWDGDKFAVFSKVDTPSPVRPNFGYIISPNLPGLPGVTVAVDRYRDETIKSQVIRATALLDTIVVQPKLGYLITGTGT